MSQQIDTALIQGYERAFRLKHQESSFRLRNAVQYENCEGERHSFQRIEPTEAKDKEGRHADTQYTDTIHSRRWVVPEEAYVSDLIDRGDTKRAAADPASAYIRNQVAALNRKKTKRVTDALLGNAITGKNGTGTAAFDTANQQIVHGGVGMNVAKIQEAQKILSLAEALGEMDDAPRFLLLTANQIDDLLSEEKLINQDYHAMRAVQSGKPGTVMGFEIIRLSLSQLPKSGSTRSCIAFVGGEGGAVGYCESESVFSAVDRLPQKHHSRQVYSAIDCGAVRQWEDMVVEIQATES